jgi:hypothetical protein
VLCHTLLDRWLPGGRREGREYVARNPRRADRTAGSFRINITTGRPVSSVAKSAQRVFRRARAIGDLLREERSVRRQRQHYGEPAGGIELRPDRRDRLQG